MRRVTALIVAVLLVFAGAVANAQVEQEGDNEGDAAQDATVRTGDGAAGAQITGLVVSGGEARVEKTNASEDSRSTSGDASSTVTATAAVGPSGAAGLIGSAAVQDGDNELDLSQVTETLTGDAVAGSQVTGAVVSGGTLDITADNVSEDAQATSGDAATEAFATVGRVGPLAEPDDVTRGCVGFGETDPPPGAIVVVINVCSITVNVVGAAQLGDAVTAVGGAVEQHGDNEADLEQRPAAGSGDAVAGAQVNGVVTSGGAVAIEASNASEDDEAASGEATASDVVSLGGVGPVDGADTLSVCVAVSGGTSVNVCFSTITVTAGPAGSVQAAQILDDALVLGPSVVQDGDNELSAAQASEATTGDAVAGAQVHGVVNDGGEVTVDADNASEDSEAVSGDATTANAATIGRIGPASGSDTLDLCLAAGGTAVNFCFNELIFEETGPPGVESQPQAAQLPVELLGLGGVVQDGDNELGVDQRLDGASGDAVAGGQVTGIVNGDGSIAFSSVNGSEDAEAVSGDVAATNSVVVDRVGPFAGGRTVRACIAEGSVLAENVCFNTGGPIDVDQLLLFFPFPFGFGAVGPAQVGTLLPGGGGIVQDGDNTHDAAQSASVGTGDAVAGAQVTGIVAGGGDATIAKDNRSQDDEAATGDSTSATAVTVPALGPVLAGGVSPTLCIIPSDSELSIQICGNRFGGDAAA